MQWSRWIDDLPQLKSYVDRCLKSKDFISVKSVQLHIVSDGSMEQYTICAFSTPVESMVASLWERQDWLPYTKSQYQDWS